MCESHSGLKGWMWEWWSVHLNCFGSRVGLQHMMLKYSQFETKQAFRWTLVSQENAPNTWFQNNGTRHLGFFWGPLIKLDLHTLCNMQHTFQHVYFSAHRKEMKSDCAALPLPPTPAALLNVQLKKELLLFSKVYFYFLSIHIYNWKKPCLSVCYNGL